MSEANSHTPFHEVDPDILGVVHHEAHIGMLALTASNPTESKASFAWMRDINKRQGDEKDERGWELTPTAAVKICESLGRAGLLEVSLDQKGMKLLNATDKATELGLPLAGALFRWSVEYPEISTQKLLGSGSRLTKARLTILDSALHSDGVGVPRASIADRFEGELGEKRDYAWQRIDDLKTFGVLESQKTSPKSVSVRIADEYKPAVSDLLEIGHNYGTGPNSFREKASVAAKEMINDTESMTLLMAKARGNSKNARTPGEIKAVQAKMEKMWNDNPGITPGEFAKMAGVHITRAHNLTGLYRQRKNGETRW